MALRKTEEERAAREAEKAERARAKRLKDAEGSFWASPVGLARSAKAAGQRWFQVDMPLVDTNRTVGSVVFGDPIVKHRAGSGQGALITAIEDEGWELFQAGFVFHETGQVSRDKLLSSGQTVQTTGRTFGVYLFRATDAVTRTDSPWVDAIVAAEQEAAAATATVAAGWYPEPDAPGFVRWWDGVGWGAARRPAGADA
jgi:hypothetical protein